MSDVRLEVQDGIGTITFDAPERLNSVRRETWLALGDACARLEDDESVRVVILTGAGDKAFVAGADIKNHLQSRDALESLSATGQRVLDRLEGLPQPVIAAINGYALGGGCEIALACDIRIASDRAKLGQPELNLGVIPAAGGTQRLPRLVGAAKALELILTGRIIDAVEAERIGLVNLVVPHAELLSAARVMAAEIMRKAPLAVALAKRVVRRGIDSSLTGGLEIERFAQALLFGTEDKQEGVAAFIEKRQPRFKGR